MGMKLDIGVDCQLYLIRDPSHQGATIKVAYMYGLNFRFFTTIKTWWLPTKVKYLLIIAGALFYDSAKLKIQTI